MLRKIAAALVCFGPGEYPMTSGMEHLESIEYIEECYYVPDPPPPPKPDNPNNPGHNNPGNNPGHPNPVRPNPGRPGHGGHAIPKVISLEKSVSFDLELLSTDVEDTSKAV